MRSKKKREFSVHSRNVLLALLVLAAAFAVYGVADAAVVSHQGSEIVSKVGNAVNADDSARFQGLAASDILAQSGSGSQNPYGYGFTIAMEICSSSSYALPSTKPGTITGACSEWSSIPPHSDSGTCYFYKTCNTCRVCVKNQMENHINLFF